MPNFDDWQPLEGYVYYRSGLGRSPSDLKGMIEARAPIGVSATDLRPSAVGLLLDYLRHKGEVFVDSGAFGAFRSGQEVDWDQVLNTYAELADNGQARPSADGCARPEKGTREWVREPAASCPSASPACQKLILTFRN